MTYAIQPAKFRHIAYCVLKKTAYNCIVLSQFTTILGDAKMKKTSMITICLFLVCSACCLASAIDIANPGVVNVRAVQPRSVQHFVVPPAAACQPAAPCTPLVRVVQPRVVQRLFVPPTANCQTFIDVDDSRFARVRTVQNRVVHRGFVPIDACETTIDVAAPRTTRARVVYPRSVNWVPTAPVAYW